MKLGAERKKVLVLGGLLVVAAVIFWINSAPEEPPRSARTGALITAPATGPRQTAPQQTPNVSRPQPTRAGRSLQEFRPSLKPRKPEERVDPMSVDPRIRLDILAKLQAVSVEGARRSIFDFSAAPPAKPVETAKAKPKVPNPLIGPQPPPKPVEESATASAPAPPIPLKFYGYVNPVGAAVKRAFFLEGEEVFVVNEGDMVKRRYKIVRIGINSVVVEDTEFKKEQTLPLEEVPG